MSEDMAGDHRVKENKQQDPPSWTIYEYNKSKYIRRL